VIYLADSVVDQAFELFGVPIDASSPAVSLTASPVELEGVQLSLDGRFVYFLSEPAGTRRNDLYRAHHRRQLRARADLPGRQPAHHPARSPAQRRWKLGRLSRGSHRAVRDGPLRRPHRWQPRTLAAEPVHRNRRRRHRLRDRTLAANGWCIARTRGCTVKSRSSRCRWMAALPRSASTGTSFPAGTFSTTSLSPDGNWVAFRANRTIDTAGEL
jgi:hypothetical protein